MKFSALTTYFEKLEATTKRLEMFDILAELFAHASGSDIDKIIYLSQGQLLPPYRGLDMGMSAKLLMRALSKASGLTMEEVKTLYDQNGDLGFTAEEAVRRKIYLPPETLFEFTEEAPRAETVSDVYSILMRIAKTSGSGSMKLKIQLTSDLMKAVSPVEARYITRIVIGRLRLGLGDPTVLEALALSRGDRGLRPELERAYNLCCDLGLVASTLLKDGMDAVRNFKIRVGYPIRMALCERLGSVEEIVNKVGKAAIETKYDGFRVQVHIDGSNVEMFSRNLERTTPMFPEIAEAAHKHLKTGLAVIEGEAMAFDEDTGRLLPFQVTIQRKRKYGIKDMARKYPLKFFAFDLLYLDGSDWTEKPFIERRKQLEELVMPNAVIKLSSIFVSDNADEIARAFDKAVKDGFEGIVVKRLDSGYTAGSRNFNWIKLKQSYSRELSDTIDVCIVGYFLGRGARARFGIGGVLAAVYDESSDTFKTITKIGSGFTEDELGKFKAMLDTAALGHRHPRVDSDIEADVWVEPRFVIAVTADELTRSPLHTAGRDKLGVGFALRFPRFVGKLRSDKNPEDATSVHEIERIFEMQTKNVSHG